MKTVLAAFARYSLRQTDACDIFPCFSIFIEPKEVNEAIKILVFSDSHGKSSHMSNAILKEKPDLLLFMGDGLYDLYRMQTEFALPATGVKGNCDMGVSEQTSRTLNIDGMKIYMTHGHIYGVKSGYDTVIDAAKSAGADVLLFGHTHHAVYEMSGALHVLNPGSIFDGNYGLIEIKDSKPFCRLKSV